MGSAAFSVGVTATAFTPEIAKPDAALYCIILIYPLVLTNPSWLISPEANLALALIDPAAAKLILWYLYSPIDVVTLTRNGVDLEALSPVIVSLPTLTYVPFAPLTTVSGPALVYSATMK